MAPSGDVEYLMKAMLRQTTLALQFDHQAVAALFDDQSEIGRTGEVFLVEYDGRFLTPPRHDPSKTLPDRAVEFREHCRSGTDAFIDVDYRGIRTIQGFRPLSALGTACVAARVGYDESVAPAAQLREPTWSYAARGSW